MHPRRPLDKLIRWVVTHRPSKVIQLTANAAVGAATAQQTQGPFHVAQVPERADLREDRQGLTFELGFQVLGADGTPFSGASVDIWHCDVEGRYSGYPEDIARRPWETVKLVGILNPNAARVPAFNAKTYLRGKQVSGRDGQVRFTTIFPGWYDPRVPHVHVAVTVAGQRQFTSQIYFPRAFVDEIYANHAAYRPHGACPYRHETDPVLTEFHDATGLLVTPQYVDDALAAKVGLKLPITASPELETAA